MSRIINFLYNLWALRIGVVVLVLSFASVVFSADECVERGAHPYYGCGDMDRSHTYGGTRLKNWPSGYVVGWLVNGGSFDRHETSDCGWYWGRAGESGTSVNMCAWVEPESLESCNTTVPDSCSQSTKDCFSNRDSFGTDFQGDTDGVDRAIISGCPLYLNYFSGSCPDGLRTGALKDYVGAVPSTQVKYRYKTLDGQAAMVHVVEWDYSSYNWGFIPMSCFNVGQPSGCGGDSCGTSSCRGFSERITGEEK